MIGKNKKQSETIHHGNPTDFKNPLFGLLKNCQGLISLKTKAQQMP